MTQLDKLVDKLLNSPESLKYKDIEKALVKVGFIKVPVKRGSHVKFKHPKLDQDLVIPIHKNDCKLFYKKEAQKFAQKIKR